MSDSEPLAVPPTGNPEETIEAPTGPFKVAVWRTFENTKALTVYDQKLGNMGTFFLADKKFPSGNALNPHDLSKIVVANIPQKSLSTIEKNADLLEGFNFLKKCASGEIELSSDSAPRAYLPNTKNRAGFWKNDFGYVITLRNYQQINMGSYFLSNQTFSGFMKLSEREFAGAALEALPENSVKILDEAWNGKKGMEVLRGIAEGRKVTKENIISRTPATSTNAVKGRSIPDGQLEVAGRAEIATAGLLDVAQNCNSMNVVHSVVLGKSYLGSASLDHVVVMDRTVFLVNTTQSKNRISAHQQKQNLERYEVLAHLMQKRLSQIMKAPIAVEACVAVWTDKEFVQLKESVVKAESIVDYLTKRNSVGGRELIGKNDVTRKIANRETWKVTPLPTKMASTGSKDGEADDIKVQEP